MSEDENNESQDWSSTQREVMRQEKERDGAKVMEANEDGTSYHDKYKVAVYQKDVKMGLPIYKVRIETLQYNFENGRLWKYKKRKCIENGIDPDDGLDPEIEEHQKIVHNMLLNTKSYSRKPQAVLKEELILLGQEDPCLITDSGVIWNGNRRCATMKDIFANPPPSGIGKLENGFINVCFLPDAMDITQLKDLEDRLQRQKDTREEYGQLNEMGDCWKQIEEFDFAGGDYTTATADEKKEIEGKLESRRDWNKWKKIVHGKETIDLMDEYLDSRTDDNGISRSGNYDYIEKNDGGLTWWEDVRLKILPNVVKYYENPNHDGDPEEKLQAYKAMLFAIYDLDGPEFEQLRKLEKTFLQADTGGARDTTAILETFERNSPILSKWEEYAEEADQLIQNDTIAETEKNNLEANGRAMEQLGQAPKVLLDRVLQIMDIMNKDLINPNDAELLDKIEECRTRLQEIEDQTNGNSA